MTSSVKAITRSVPYWRIVARTGSLLVAASGARRQLIQSYPAACTALNVLG